MKFRPSFHHLIVSLAAILLCPETALAHPHPAELSPASNNTDNTDPVEAWKGFQFQPETLRLSVPANQTVNAAISIQRTVPMNEFGYYSGDTHLHLDRSSARSDAQPATWAAIRFTPTAATARRSMPITLRA